VIGEPLARGKLQLTITLLPLIEVVGAAGVDGTAAASKETSEEYVEYP